MTVATEGSHNIPEHPRRRKTSLRSRITLAIAIVSVLASVAVGGLIISRNLSTQTFLGTRFENEVKEKAETQIEALAQQEAQSIDRFFLTVDNSIVSTSNYIVQLLNNETAFQLAGIGMRMSGYRCAPTEYGITQTQTLHLFLHQHRISLPSKIFWI